MYKSLVDEYILNATGAYDKEKIFYNCIHNSSVLDETDVNILSKIIDNEIAKMEKRGIITRRHGKLFTSLKVEKQSTL